MYALGQTYGTEVRDTNITKHMILLDFGTPGTNGGVPGAWMTRNKGHVPVLTGSALAQQFLFGWLSATANTDHHLWLAFGVNNYGTGVTTANAEAWSGAMAYARATVIDPRAHWVFALDAEQEWNTFAITKAYQDAYMNGFSGCVPGIFENACIYNFGTANCGYSSTNQYCGFSDWDKDDIWYLSGGQRHPQYGNNYAAALPEIYNTLGNNARQWQSVSRYGATTPVRWKLYFVGVLTTAGACAQVGPGSCVGFDNSPAMGYQQLYQHLNADPLTAQSPILWSTDIRYQVYP
jgi:hypothetical protein